MLMSDLELIESLLELGRLAKFDSIAALPGAGVHADVLAFSDRVSRRLVERFQSMPEHDRVALIKAIAVYEHSVGGLGSCTALWRLLPLITDEDHNALDWILQHTCSYQYYAWGAHSFAELQAIRHAHALRREHSLNSERERAELARVRRAERATANLFNAVRRGDANAVRALLRSGANPHSCAPDGTSLSTYAASIGRVDIADLLQTVQEPPEV